MSRKRHCRSTAASGANEANEDDDDAAFDIPITQRWVAWRAKHPVRASGGVLRTYHRRPNNQRS